MAKVEKIAKEKNINTEEVIVNATEMVANQAMLNSVAVMDAWGNGEVYNEDRWVERAKQAARQALEGLFELGRALIIIKEHTEHGRFTNIVETELGLHRRETARIIMATKRFASPQMKQIVPKLADLGKSKLMELLIEEDEKLIELAEGGEIAGKKLDDIDCMSVRELRKALRDSRDETEAARKVSGDKDKKINELNEKLLKKQKIKDSNPQDMAEELKLQMSSVQVGVESQISRLNDVFAALVRHDNDNGLNSSSMMVGCLNQIILTCEVLRDRFNLPNNASAEIQPEWLNESELKPATE